MENENAKQGSGSVFSKAIRAGRRRTYFFDVKSTKGNDYYITITESKKKFNDEGYERHKIFLYKEDFNKFLEAMTEAINYVKTELLPEYDFDEFSKNNEVYNNEQEYGKSAEGGSATSGSGASSSADDDLSL